MAFLGRITDGPPTMSDLLAPVIGGVLGVMACIVVPLLIVRYHRRRRSATTAHTRRTVDLHDLEFGDVYAVSSNQGAGDLLTGPVLKIGALPGGKSTPGPGPVSPPPGAR